MNLSVVLAVFNEQQNLGRCLASVKGIADEIVVVDGGSTDRTVEIAETFGARVIRTGNPAIFHINKQKALDAAQGDWILQLDADEEVTPALAEEILEICRSGPRKKTIPTLFLRHQRLLELRDGSIGKPTGEIVAYFVPRLNYFLGGPIRHAGTYPDGVIRLVKRGKARFPSRSVHEQIEVDGGVAWLEHDLLHYSNRTVFLYWKAAGKYIRLQTGTMEKDNLPKNPFSVVNYLLIRPVIHFFRLYIRHKGFLDGWRGFLFCLFSVLHEPMAYMHYLKLT